MIQPNIKYYALFADVTGSNKTPKYRIIKEAGFFPQMESLRGKDGFISMYLMEKTTDKASSPQMKLQAKNSLNFTGLKDYFIEGKISGFAYGYPNENPTYSSKKTPNPFYDVKTDGYLFRFFMDKQPDGEALKPTGFEMIVIEGGNLLAGSYLKQMIMHGFDELLERLRGLAK
ncbi:MAG: hypothetical protein HUK07_01720 [Bacteroidaceae bacterium]|nr:hypothetical protein [Bacteroidaceae bacterium]